MKRVCAWCNTAMGDAPSDVHDMQAITHGICDTCLHSLFSNKDVDFIPFLNTIDAPIVLIDDNNTYLAANDTALKILDKQHIQLKNKQTGDVFKCENSKLPGGCGHTDKCGGCQMLQLVNGTYSGNNSFNNVPVTLTRKKDNSREKLDLRVSTDKVNGMVLMRIDQFETETLDHS